MTNDSSLACNDAVSVGPGWRCVPWTLSLYPLAPAGMHIATQSCISRNNLALRGLFVYVFDNTIRGSGPCAYYQSNTLPLQVVSGKKGVADIFLLVALMHDNTVIFTQHNYHVLLVHIVTFLLCREFLPRNYHPEIYSVVIDFIDLITLNILHLAMQTDTAR